MHWEDDPPRGGRSTYCPGERTTLERHGCHVVTAKTGEQPVDVALTTPEIDLVLMDINLSAGIDGTVAAEQILEERNLHLVFLSSHTDPEVVDKTERITSYESIVKNSGVTVLTVSIRMAFRLFESRKIAGDTFEHSINGLCKQRVEALPSSTVAAGRLSRRINHSPTGAFGPPPPAARR